MATNVCNYQLSANFCFSKRTIDEVFNSFLTLIIPHQNLSKTKTTFLATVQKPILHSTLTFRKFQVSKKKKFNDESYQNPISTLFSHKRLINTPIGRFGSSMSKIDVFSKVYKNHFLVCNNQNEISNGHRRKEDMETKTSSTVR